MIDDLILFPIRIKNKINNLNNIIESKKIFELENEDLENELLIITILNNKKNLLTEEEKEILKKANNFVINLNEKCKKETLSKEEQKILKELLVNTILHGNTKVDKDTLAIFVHKYVSSQTSFSSSDLVLYTQHVFNFLNETQGNNIKLKFAYIDSIMAAEKTPNGENIIQVNPTIFEDSQAIKENQFHNLLMKIILMLLHETFHIREFEYLKRAENIGQEELFNDILIATNKKEYKKYHDSLLIERAANEYAINNLPYILQRIIPEEELASYQNKLRKNLELTPTKEYIQKQEQLVQDTKELLTPEAIETLSETIRKK